jgi:hypothetical protein
MTLWVELWVGLLWPSGRKSKRNMVGTRRLELLTSTVSR